ncbi:hypothetical protein AKO1_012392 [Acrasis kona]|uniref:Uncharacterized protein n=1 Tax=Acrasis kona TaxID=1008807 RepID=A0AAW2YXB3_9EUKA
MATIKVVSNDDLKKVDRAIIATFNEGNPTVDSSFDVYVKSGKNSEQRVLYGQTDLMHYESLNEQLSGETNKSESNSRKRKFVQYAVGVYDEAKKTIKLCPLDQVYELEQKPKSKMVDEENFNFNEQRRKFMNDYGSNAYKKAVAQVQRYGMKVHTKSLNLKGQALNALKQENKFFAMRHLLPKKINNRTKVVRDIYPIDDLVKDITTIDPRLLEAIGMKTNKKDLRAVVKVTSSEGTLTEKSIQTMLGDLESVDVTINDEKSALVTFESVRHALKFLKAEGEEKIKKNLASHVVDTSKKLQLPIVVYQAIQAKKEDLEWLQNNVKAIQYLIYLFGLYNARERINFNEAIQEMYEKNSSNNKIPNGWLPLDEKTAKAIYKPYTSKDKLNTRTPEHTAKLIVHIILVGLHISGFKLSVNTFTRDLKKTSAQVAPYFFALGCKRSTDVKDVFTLTAPLKKMDDQVSKPLEEEEQDDQEE